MCGLVYSRWRTLLKGSFFNLFECPKAVHMRLGFVIEVPLSVKIGLVYEEEEV